MSESIHFEPEVIDDIYSLLGIDKPKETFQQIVEQNLIKETYKMGYAEAAQKNQTEQMTKITSTMPIEDYVLINGVKYKRVEESQLETDKEYEKRMRLLEKEEEKKLKAKEKRRKEYEKLKNEFEG